MEKLTEDTSRVIRVWQFDDAPKEVRDLSPHGGDEDWLAHIPPVLTDEYFPWMADGSPFGCCCVSEHKLPDGSIVRIGAHA